MVTGTHPLLPLNITEATYLLPPPNALLSTTTLIANQAIALQKCHFHLVALTSDIYTMCIKATVCFEQEHATTITDFNFKFSNLILI